MRHLSLALGLTLAVPPALSAQAPSTPPAAEPAATAAAPSLDALAALVLGRFASGDPAAFDSVHPDPDARQLVRWAAEAKWPLHEAGGGVVWSAGDSAVVWLAGYAESGHSGYETSLGRMFTGLWAAYRDSAGWRLGGKLELDQGGRIASHAIGADLRPGDGMALRDTLEVETGPRGGFWASLNRVARLDSVLVDGRPAEHRFAAGLLHVSAPASRQVQIVLAYDLDVARDSARNGYFARFDRDFGHVRNQHYWHPFFGFRNARGEASFRLTVRAPADVHVATDLPQRDTIIGGTRVVTAETGRPTEALTLMYDRGWKPSDFAVGSMRVRLAVDDSVQPSRAAIEAALARVHRVLSGRFGEPRSPYLLVAQGRGVRGYGWIFRSNDMLAGGPVGGDLMRPGARPRAFFGHEAAHGWTAPTGPGSIWLSEGWAMYAETLLLADELGAEAAANAWEAMRAEIHTGGYDGKESLAGDAFNSGVSYPKGAWVLRMLEDRIGSPAFERGMRSWMNLPESDPPTVDAFIREMSAAAGSDVRPFLRPWLEETVPADVTARVEGGRLIVSQSGPVFPLTVDVDLVTARDTVRRTIELAAAADTFDVGDVRDVADVLLDPDHRLLLRRHRGETVTFSIAAPDAEKVELGGSFTSQRVAAARGEDGVWRAALPLTAGRYSRVWFVDGERREDPQGDLLVVRPREAVAGAYPR